MRCSSLCIQNVWVNNAVVGGFIEGGSPEEQAALKKMAEVLPFLIIDFHRVCSILLLV